MYETENRHAPRTLSAGAFALLAVFVAYPALSGTNDYGAQAMSSIASVMKNDNVTAELMEKYLNLAKFFYRCALPSGTLAKRM